MTRCILSSVVFLFLLGLDFSQYLTKNFIFFSLCLIHFCPLSSFLSLYWANFSLIYSSPPSIELCFQHLNFSVDLCLIRPYISLSAIPSSVNRDYIFINRGIWKKVILLIPSFKFSFYVTCKGFIRACSFTCLLWKDISRSICSGKY